MFQKMNNPDSRTQKRAKDQRDFTSKRKILRIDDVTHHRTTYSNCIKYAVQDSPAIYQILMMIYHILYLIYYFIMVLIKGDT